MRNGRREFSGCRPVSVCIDEVESGIYPWKDQDPKDEEFA